jgi:CRP/FNR family transcriptional regulator, cyclic AMP receptor protein
VNVSNDLAEVTQPYPKVKVPGPKGRLTEVVMLLAANKCLANRPNLLSRGLLTPGIESIPWLRPAVGDRFSPVCERSTVLAVVPDQRTVGETPAVSAEPIAQEREIDPFYLFACHIEWEKREDSGAGWELIAAAQSSNSDTRAHARALLAASRHLGGIGTAPVIDGCQRKMDSNAEVNMKTPYGLDIIESCTECRHTRPGFYCDFSQPVVHALNQVSHKSILPAGAILFVEGQTPRGMFILCSGRVNLSTASREGKVLILKTVEAGETLGLSAAISGAGYETTAETATPCQLNFVDRKHLLELLQSYTEVGVHTAQSLSRDFQSAYRDIHDLVLTRSSAGKLARLLLSQSPAQSPEMVEIRIPSSMTHEEMAHRIGASRETVTRLLSDLKKKQLIRLDGPTLVIRNRPALEALAV